jgi:glycosyltransferase involved in cell wall biosynthesis
MRGVLILPRRRILFLCLEAPWRLNAGALIRNYWMVRGLARRYDVDLVIAEKTQESVPADFARSCASITAFDAPTGFRARVARGLESLLPHESYFTAGRVPHALRLHVAAAVMRTDYAAIHIDDLPIQSALPADHCPPIVYASHNCEFALFHRRAQLERGPLRALSLFDAGRVRRIETALVRSAVLVTACSSDDVHDLETYCGLESSRAAVIPNGVDVARYEPVVSRSPEPNAVLISGSMDWRPNQQGLRWFLNDVLPQLARIAQPGEINVRVAGRMTAQLQQELAAYPGVVAVPNPIDMRDELARARIVVAPILASSGTRLRILEAWASGRPVVTTPAGAFGLEYTDGDEIVCATDPQQFAASIVRVLRDAGLWQRIRDRAALRVKQYDWTRICESIETSHASVL